MSNGSAGTFVLDTNVFIEAYRRYYAMDLCPGFWKCLKHYCEAGRIVSIDHVRSEISEGDALHAWTKNAPSDLFASTTEEAIASAFAEMMGWTQDSGNFTEPAINEFADAADGWLIAFAKVRGFVVVTHEAFEPDRKNKVKIPNVCRQFNVAYVEPFSMLRSLGVTFDWE